MIYILHFTYIKNSSLETLVSNSASGIQFRRYQKFLRKIYISYLSVGTRSCFFLGITNISFAELLMTTSEIVYIQKQWYWHQ